MESLKKKFMHYSKFEKRDFLFCYLLIAIPVLQFAVFWVYVNISSVTLAFQTNTGEFTWNNMRAAFQAFKQTDTYGLDLGDSISRSMIIWVVDNIICTPIGLVTTFVLQRRIFGHYVWRICYLIPGLMGSVIWTSLIKFMVSYDGPIVTLLVSMGADFPEMALRNGLFGAEATAFPTLIAITFIMNIVGNSVVLTGAYSRIPDELFESANLDGAGFWRECFSIAIPCVWSTIATLKTFSLCSIFTADANVFLYSNGTGQPGMSTVGFHLYYIMYNISLMGAGRASFGYPAALGLTLTLMTLPVVFIGRWILEKIQEPVEL